MAEVLKIKIAGKSILLKSEQGDLPGYIRNLPADFQKKALPKSFKRKFEYLVLFQDASQMRFPKDNGLDSAIEIKNNSGRFDVLLKSKPEIKLGRIYPDKGKADFFVYGEQLNKNYFIPFLRNSFQFFIAQAGEFILHASAIVKNGEGTVFTGPSGAGKTTISNFYSKESVLSDEFIYLRKIKGEYFISAMPWRSQNLKTCRLAKIIFPKKSKELKIIKESPVAAICKIMPNILHMPKSFKISENILSFLIEATKKVPCYTMRFPKNDKFMEEI
ncbi:MAG: hypothetical protein KAJ48_03495 [Elusimicrobiales bacterium]|nr:hypothetical protein [Elusimicrobiales bacterium]